jgi:hyperosmotically inducible periplasmic protein
MNRILVRSSLALVATLLVFGAKADGTEYRSDPWITLKAKIALLTADDLDAHAIHVDTINGHVTLHGKVDTGAEQARAEQVAAHIDGVIQVRNLLQIVPENKRKETKLDDAALRDRAMAGLQADAALNDSHITVKSVNKGVVLLSGSAASLSDHLRAIRDVDSVDGVRRVASEVHSPDVLSDREIATAEERDHAAPPSSEKGVTQALSDMWITTATKTRLMADSETPAMQINVDTDNGAVTLFGVVPTESAKKAAEADTLKVSGVKRVVNDLQVVPDKDQRVVAIRDEETLSQADKKLQGHAEFKHVTVEVKNGVARLSGTVANASDRIMAAVVVRSCDGVRSVNNDIVVKLT